MERLTDSLDWFTHGWHAFVGAWLVVIVGMWAGLWLRGANTRPIFTAPTPPSFVAVLAMLAAAALKTGLDAAGIAGPLRADGTFAIFPLFGLLAGPPSSDPARTVIHRGAVIEDGRPASGGRGGELTLAGIPIPPMDETKHFKMVGTTGTGKSTAIRELLEGALARGDRAVIADPDGGYLDRFYDAEPRRRDPESLRPTRPHLEHLRRADRQPRRRTTRTFPDPRPGRRRQELARLRAHLLHRRRTPDQRRRHPRPDRALPPAHLRLDR